jgi:hypothetical protein
MLTYLNNKFTNSSSKIKIELYLLPLMLFYLAYYLSSNTSVNENTNEIKNNTNFTHYQNKKFEGSFLELFSSIERSAKEVNMQVKSLKNKMNIVELKVDGKKENMLMLIKRIENINNFTKIDSISIYGKNDLNIYYYDFKIDLNKYYIKKFQIQKQESKIEKIIHEKIQTEPKINYKLKAIIANYILINDKWIKLGGDIDDFKVIDINRNFVILENDNKKLKLELVNEEYIKNIY